MYKVNQIKVKIDQNRKEFPRLIAKKLNLRVNDIKNVKLIKRSIDARNKDNVHYSCSFSFEISIDEQVFLSKVPHKLITKIEERQPLTLYKTNKKIIIVGAGPSGLFTALLLLKAGNQVIIIERGEDVDKRKESVESFFETAVLNPDSNIQFGEGGAGTFSDGKLTTSINNPLIQDILEIFVSAGAPEEILYEAKPHIGTDYLVTVVKNLRKQIIDLGGTILFETKLVDIVMNENKLKAIKVKNKDTILEVYLDALVLAIGHSARDTYEMLHKHNIEMQQKTFAVGVRIEHPQDFINVSQYGEKFKHKLGAADYKLAYHTKDNRGVYTFCMCPGGYVVASSSEEGHLVVNGMSEFARDGKNANSAILVNIFPSDFSSDDPLEGIRFQRDLERKAFLLGGSDYSAPISLLKDYMENAFSAKLEDVIPTYRPRTRLVNINHIFPDFINTALKEGIESFNRKIDGFNMDNAVITGVESRSSSPLRIVRNEHFETNIKGVYPIGEGAGYAGGITSSCLDGLKFALDFMKVNND